MCCLNVGHAKSHPLSHCLLPWYDAFVLWFFHLQPLTWCFLLLQLLLMTSYAGHFPLSYFSSTVSIGLLLHSVYFLFVNLLLHLEFWHIFSCIFMFSLCPAGELSLCLLSILGGMLYLFKSIKTDLAQVFWIFLYEYLNLSSLIVICYNTWNIFCMVCAWISPAMQSGISDVWWEPTLAVTLQHCFCRASSRILHGLLNLLLLLFDYVILLKDVIAFVYDSSEYMSS